MEVEYGRVDGFIDKYFISVAGTSSNLNYIRVVRLTNYGQTPTITLDTNKHIWMSMDTYVYIRVKAYGNFSISGTLSRTAPTGTTIPINRLVTESDLKNATQGYSEFSLTTTSTVFSVPGAVAGLNDLFVQQGYNTGIVGKSYAQYRVLVAGTDIKYTLIDHYEGVSDWAISTQLKGITYDSGAFKVTMQGVYGTSNVRIHVKPYLVGTT